MKTGDLTIVYGMMAVLSVLLAVFCLFWDKKRERLFVTLFGCVAMINCGYFLLAISNSLEMAKLANGVSYFGAAFSMLLMLFIICDVCRIKKRIWLNWILGGISACVFLLAAGADWRGLYYKSLSIEQVNGMTRLVKEYGPLHDCYSLYLMGYLILMMVVIAYSTGKKRLASPKYALFLLVAVFLNIGVWAVEQAVDVTFEFLSVSYIVTEILLLLIYGMLYDYGIIRPGAGIVSASVLTQMNNQTEAYTELPGGMEELFDSFVEKVATLSLAERRILDYYINGREINEIPELAFISINTVKKHNRSIYQKLGVASRDELMLYIELFRCCGREGELRGDDNELS